MAAHTPGPWTLHPDGIPYVNCGQAGPAFGPVVLAGSTDEMMANARLIAAAPDLLAACKAQLNALDMLFAMLIARDKTFLPSQSGPPWDAMVAGNAAVARATGEAG